MPRKPEAWLFTTARRRLIDRARHDRVHAEAEPTIRLLVDGLSHGTEAMDDLVFPDDRLKLLFVCAHPEVDRGMHTPLMLQVVLGLDAATIASAFLTSPAAMGQRLSRAKARIRDAGIAFEVPDRRELPARLDAVLDAIYAAYGTGWDDVAGSDPRRAVWRRRRCGSSARCSGCCLTSRKREVCWPWCSTARRVGRPGAPRTATTCRCRRRTLGSGRRRSSKKRNASSLPPRRKRRAGRFQLEAALQSAHVEGALRGQTDWRAIAVLYEGLLRATPTAGAFVGRAAALAEAESPAAGLSALNRIDPSLIKSYQPYWAVRAHLLRRAGRVDEALGAYDRAIGLTEDAATRQFLLCRRAELPLSGI